MNQTIVHHLSFPPKMSSMTLPVRLTVYYTWITRTWLYINYIRAFIINLMNNMLILIDISILLFQDKNIKDNSLLISHRDPDTGTCKQVLGLLREREKKRPCSHRSFQFLINSIEKVSGCCNSCSKTDEPGECQSKLLIY